MLQWPCMTRFEIPSQNSGKKLEITCNRSLQEPGAPDVPGEIEGDEFVQTGDDTGRDIIVDFQKCQKKDGARLFSQVHTKRGETMDTEEILITYKKIL